MIKWLLGIISAVLGFFSFRKYSALREHRELNRAVRAVEKQLAKNDAVLDEQARKKIEGIRSATRDILNRTSRTGGDANALIEKVRGDR